MCRPVKQHAVRTVHRTRSLRECILGAESWKRTHRHGGPCRVGFRSTDRLCESGTHCGSEHCRAQGAGQARKGRSRECCHASWWLHDEAASANRVAQDGEGGRRRGGCDRLSRQGACPLPTFANDQCRRSGRLLCPSVPPVGSFREHGAIEGGHIFDRGGGERATASNPVPIPRPACQGLGERDQGHSTCGSLGGVARAGRAGSGSSGRPRDR